VVMKRKIPVASRPVRSHVIALVIILEEQNIIQLKPHCGNLQPRCSV